MCTKAPTTVDYETVNRGSYLEDLEACLKRFNGALTMTMNSYRDLLTAFDQMAQVFGNIAGDLKPEVKDPIIAMRDGMRDLKDKGPFITLNSDLHEGTISVIDPLRVDLKKAQKSLVDLKAKQKEYDSLRNKVDKKEKEYAKKDRPLKDSKEYSKDVEKRNKAKNVYENKRDSFEGEVASLKSLTENIIIKSMNNYLHCTATFSGYLETTMNSYRTDMDLNGNPNNATREIKMDRVKEEAERRSVTKRQVIAMNATTLPSTYPSDEGAVPASHTNTADSTDLKSPQKTADSTSHLSGEHTPQYPKKSPPSGHESPLVAATSPTNHEQTSGDAGANEGGEGIYPVEGTRNPLTV